MTGSETTDGVPASMWQPSRDADVRAWRRYAGMLRQRLGEAQRLADPVVAAAKVAADVEEMHAEVGLARTRVANARAAADARVRAANEVAKRRKKHRRLASRRRSRMERVLGRVHQALRRGDMPRAFELIEGALSPSVARHFGMEMDG